MCPSMSTRCDTNPSPRTGGGIPPIRLDSAASSHRPSAGWGVFLHGGLGCAPAAAGDEVGHQAGPPGLVRRAEAGAVVTVEVLMERNEVVPGRIGLELLLAREDGPAAAGIVEEQRGEPPRQIGRHLLQRRLLTRSVRVLH